MALSKKQIEDLERSAPESLRVPSLQPFGNDPKEALMRWARAKGLGPTEIMQFPYADPDDDEIVGVALVGHACAMALWLRAATEVEREKTLKIRAAESKEVKLPRPINKQLVFLTRFQKIDDFKPGLRGQRTKLTLEAKRVYEQLKELRAKERELEEQQEALLERFDALKSQMFIPIEASRYFDNPHRSERVAEETSLVFYLMSVGMPLLRSIAMIGGLRNDDVPVDVEHPKLEAIYESHLQNVKVLRRAIMKSMEDLNPFQPNPSLGAT